MASEDGLSLVRTGTTTFALDSSLSIGGLHTGLDHPLTVFFGGEKREFDDARPRFFYHFDITVGLGLGFRTHR